MRTYDDRTEAWHDAPPGADFDLTIPSSRSGRGPYRVSRDTVGNVVTILHQPPCEAWTHGRKECRHVREACAQAGRPADHAMYVIADAMNSGQWTFRHMHPDVEALLGSIRRAVDEWAAGMERLNEAERVASRAPITEADVPGIVDEFAQPAPGYSR